MKSVSLCALLLQLFVLIGWAADWPMPGGNPQRNGWAGSERQLTKANVNSLRLLYKYQTDNQSHGSNALTPPIVNGNLITYRGFKEMLLVAGSSDRVYSLDADLNRLLWEINLPYTGVKPSAQLATSPCAGGLTAPIIMAGSSSSSLHFAALARRAPAVLGPPGTRLPTPSPYLPPLAQSVYPLLPTTLTELNALYAVSSDGNLHVINSSTGEDLIPSMRFLPPHPKVSSLNLHNNVLYATTANNCDGYANALFAIDLLSPQKIVTSFVAQQGEFVGAPVTAIGNDGTLYVQLAYPPSAQSRRYFDTVVALSPKDLKVKDYFAIGKKPLGKSDAEASGITPAVFSFPGRDLIIAGGRNGRLYLLDGKSLGGADHHTPLFMSDTLTTRTKHCAGAGFHGAFSSWFDVDAGLRRFYVPVAGAVASQDKTNVSTNGNGDSAILAFELRGTNEHPTLEHIWTSRALTSPAPPVIANGMLFVLSRGALTCVTKRHSRQSEVQSKTEPATLYAFDALTGKELYASGDTGARVSESAGLALANGRAYFTALDNAIYCFGIPAQQTQLAGQ